MTQTQDSNAIFKSAHHNKMFLNTKHRVINVRPVTMMRASFIFFDSSKMPLEAINQKRNEILQSNRLKIPFSEMIAKYNTNGTSKDGDTGWFEDGDMIPEFNQAFKEHQEGELFTVDAPNRNWYFVVHKTVDKEIRYRVTILQI